MSVSVDAGAGAITTGAGPLTACFFGPQPPPAIPKAQQSASEAREDPDTSRLYGLDAARATRRDA